VAGACGIAGAGRDRGGRGLVAMSAASSGPSASCGMSLGTIVNTSCITDAQGAGVRVGTPDSWLLAHFPVDQGGFYATSLSGYNVERDYAVRGTNTVWWVFCEGHAGRVLAKHRVSESAQQGGMC